MPMYVKNKKKNARSNKIYRQRKKLQIYRQRKKLQILHFKKTNKQTNKK